MYRYVHKTSEAHANSHVALKGERVVGLKVYYVIKMIIGCALQCRNA